MKTEVTKEQFYNEIRERNLNLTVSAVGDYPYTTEFKFGNGILFGKIVRTPSQDRSHYPFYKTQYFKM